MRNLTLLLLVFMLALLCIKRAKANEVDFRDCSDYLTMVNPELLPNAPNYSGKVPFNSKAIPAYCTCMVLCKDSGRAIDLDSITECQALSGLLSILEV